MKSLTQDPKVLKFYPGFTDERFYCLLDFLGDGMNSLIYRGSSGASNSNSEDLRGGLMWAWAFKETNCWRRAALRVNQVTCWNAWARLSYSIWAFTILCMPSCYPGKFRQKSSTIGDSFPHGSARTKHKHLTSGGDIAILYLFIYTR